MKVYIHQLIIKEMIKCILARLTKLQIQEIHEQEHEQFCDQMHSCKIH